MAITRLGPADFALQSILIAWVETLKTDADAWARTLYKFPAQVIADARVAFLDPKRPVTVISGFPIADDRPPIISVVLLNERPDTEYMGQTEGMYQELGEDPVRQIANITKPMISLMIVSDDRRNYPQVLDEIIRIGCLVAQEMMLLAGFIDLKFESANQLHPLDLYLPQHWWIRARNYEVTEENIAQVPIDMSLWTPSVVKIALASILSKEPPNDGGVTPRT